MEVAVGDPDSTLVSGVMTVLMPYVTKGAEEFAKAAGDVAFRKVKGLIDGSIPFFTVVTVQGMQQGG
jgi:hypothetical protein